MCRLHTEEPASHALRRIPRARFLYLHRRGRSWLQARYRDSPQTVWHALDRTRRQCHHRTSLLQAERQIRRFLGAPSPDQGCLDFKNLSSPPTACKGMICFSNPQTRSIASENCRGSAPCTEERDHSPTSSWSKRTNGSKEIKELRDELQAAPRVARRQAGPFSRDRLNRYRDRPGRKLGSADGSASPAADPGSYGTRN